MKCPHCGTENDFYLLRTYGGAEQYTVKEIGEDDDSRGFVVVYAEGSSDEYTGIEEESLNCGNCERIVIHDDVFSFYEKTYE